MDVTHMPLRRTDQPGRRDGPLADFKIQRSQNCLAYGGVAITVTTPDDLPVPSTPAPDSNASDSSRSTTPNAHDGIPASAGGYHVGNHGANVMAASQADGHALARISSSFSVVPAGALSPSSDSGGSGNISSNTTMHQGHARASIVDASAASSGLRVFYEHGRLVGFVKVTAKAVERFKRTAADVDPGQGVFGCPRLLPDAVCA